jgi:hypothetical protein
MAPVRRNQGKAGERDVQGEDIRREGQDRAAPSDRAGGARSPVDSMHVDAPKQRKNARGNREEGRER